jgi:hypothetical protein
MLLPAEFDPAGKVDEGGINIESKSYGMRVKPVKRPQKHRNSVYAVYVQERLEKGIRHETYFYQND